MIINFGAIRLFWHSRFLKKRDIVMESLLISRQLFKLSALDKRLFQYVIHRAYSKIVVIEVVF